jgi:hypothetical protein
VYSMVKEFLSGKGMPLSKGIPLCGKFLPRFSLRFGTFLQEFD